MRHSAIGQVAPGGTVGSSFGLIMLIYYGLTLLVRPLARHSFILRAVKRLYLARVDSNTAPGVLATVSRR